MTAMLADDLVTTCLILGAGGFVPANLGAQLIFLHKKKTFILHTLLRSGRHVRAFFKYKEKTR